MLKLTIALILAALAMAGSAPAQQPDKDMPAAERAACLAQGGKVTRMGMLQIEACELRYADAGKICRAKSNCKGLCLYTGDPKKVSRRPKGVCQPTNNNFGCRSSIDDKRHVTTLCAD